VKDSQHAYSATSILLHWVAAIIVIFLFVIGQMAEDAPKAERQELLGLHISVAVSFYLILIWRIIRRVTNIRPNPPLQAKPLMFLARWVPVMLLIGVSLMMITGPLMVWSKGYPIGVFGVFSLPSPLGEMETLHEAMEVLHKLGAKILFVGFVLHIAGVLKHVIIDRDNSLKKMLVPRNKRRY
jgi:cytochrome b561